VSSPASSISSDSAQEETVREGIAGIDGEDVLASAISASLDLRDDGRMPRDLGLADDSPAELGVDDAQMPQLVASLELPAAVEDREPR
jgi:hypothetical protein